MLPIMIFGLIVLVYLAGTRGHTFWAENEAYYSLGAQSVRSGHFLLPTFHDGMAIDKPPLMCWWIALISLPFGRVTEFSARLANVIPAIATLWFIYRYVLQNA